MIKLIINSDKSNLFSMSKDGIVLLWKLDKFYSNIEDLLIKEISTGYHLEMIQDLIIIEQYNILIQIFSNNRILIFDWVEEKIYKILTFKNDLNCLEFFPMYGKVLIGTKNRSIIEIQLKEILESLGIITDYSDKPHINNKANYVLNEGIYIYFR